MIGKTLAHYEITSQLGKGGMGEVYQATDKKLGRDVAIKVLPEEFAQDADRVARFQREAKLLASLNHPNIAAIYGLEESDGTNFLVMELVEGQTLDERIKSGAIPVEEALKLALQIAEALEAAHEKGVIHRDLKPANIKVTPDGKVKVLDFGLAKAFAGEQADLNLSNSPTLSHEATMQGVILGTAAYMSPEQARGKEVDKRADIWAFGVVLFEMLTGRQVFTGETVSDTLASVLAREPQWQSLPPNIHSRIRFLLERCLKKEPKNRYSGISDARVDIQEALADPSGVFAQPVTTVAPRTRSRILLPWITAIAGIVIIGAVVWHLRAPEPLQVICYDYHLPEGQQFTNTGYGGLPPILAVSPDGNQFVYATSEGLYLRSTGELTAWLISGTEGSTETPFFSPDGKWIGYFSIGDQKLKKISIGGGSSVTLCSVAQIVGAHWYKDDSVVYGQSPGDIMRISAEGGTPESIVKTQGKHLYCPQILPDGETILYTSTVGGTDFRIRIQSLVSGESEELFKGFGARYLATGHIVYSLPNDNKLYAVRFDLDKLKVIGGERSVVEGILQVGPLVHSAISDSGTLIYLPGLSGDPNNRRTLVWVDRNGNEEPVGAKPMFYKYPNISPDGTQVAVTDYSTGMTHPIYIWDMVRKALYKRIFEGTENICPVWAPDGKRIVFLSFGRKSGEEDISGLFWKNADGTGQDEPLSLLPGPSITPYCWPSDETIVGVEVTPEWEEHLAMLSMEGEYTKKILLGRASIERSPKISPNGRWIAYTSNVTGSEEVYVRPFPEVDEGLSQISTNGGAAPLWSQDGRELFYLNGDTVMVVSVKTDPSFELVGTPQILFRGNFVGPLPGEGTPWDIQPNGKKFLMIKPGKLTNDESAEYPRKINIILNWFEELRQKLPVE